MTSDHLNDFGARRHYDQFYSSGGWNYDSECERSVVVDLILQKLQINVGAQILEIGCGLGLHAGLLHEYGMAVTAVDISPVAIASAKLMHPGPIYQCANLADLHLEDASYDLIYSRGMSWYHYELKDPNRYGIPVAFRTSRLFKALREGGVFVLQISTDFSGGAGPGEVLYHKFDVYKRFFSQFGKIVLCTNWDGTPLLNQRAAEAHRRNIIIGTSRVSREDCI